MIKCMNQCIYPGLLYNVKWHILQYTTIQSIQFKFLVWTEVKLNVKFPNSCVRQILNIVFYILAFEREMLPKHNTAAAG